LPSPMMHDPQLAPDGMVEEDWHPNPSQPQLRQKYGNHLILEEVLERLSHETRDARTTLSPLEILERAAGVARRPAYEPWPDGFNKDLMAVTIAANAKAQAQAADTLRQVAAEADDAAITMLQKRLLMRAVEQERLSSARAE